eukprot:CAMPEP_0172152936 /NCGR_PEP_ID=MMETSP1050-20130122/1139_1 /TAXON_ID=233186 /ORGANISM="Cryptomonas curvata, Strain CCAP979/52" /LENGTH=42 /DNA_ID= /DNA_START= /DNA_END= /DNA_ORIENTATION=
MGYDRVHCSEACLRATERSLAAAGALRSFWDDDAPPPPPLPA